MKPRTYAVLSMLVVAGSVLTIGAVVGWVHADKPALRATAPLALDEIGYDLQGASANSAINSAANIRIALTLATEGDTIAAIEHLRQAHSDSRMAYRLLGATTDDEAERIGRIMEMRGGR